MHNFFAFDSIVYAWYDIVVIDFSEDGLGINNEKT
jgi:hypothetical protein